MVWKACRKHGLHWTLRVWVEFKVPSADRRLKQCVTSIRRLRLRGVEALWRLSALPI